MSVSGWIQDGKTGHLTLLDNNLTNNSLSVCVCMMRQETDTEEGHSSIVSV